MVSTYASVYAAPSSAANSPVQEGALVAHSGGGLFGGGLATGVSQVGPTGARPEHAEKVPAGAQAQNQEGGGGRQHDGCGQDGLKGRRATPRRATIGTGHPWRPPRALRSSRVRRTQPSRWGGAEAASDARRA